MTFTKKNRAFDAHKIEWKMYADTAKKLAKAKQKDKARQIAKNKDKAKAKAKTKAGKSGTFPDFVLVDGSVRLYAYTSKSPLATVLAPPTAGLTTISAIDQDLFGDRVRLGVAAKKNPSSSSANSSRCGNAGVHANPRL